MITRYHAMQCAQLRAEYDRVLRQSNLTCVTEMWLKHHMTPKLSGYPTIRADRDEPRAVKSIGGGLGIFVDNNWEKQLYICKQVCTQELKSFKILDRSNVPKLLKRSLLFSVTCLFQIIITRLVESYTFTLQILFLEALIHVIHLFTNPPAIYGLSLSLYIHP